MRGAPALALAIALAQLAAGSLWAGPPDVITAARYAEPTSRYQHGVFGNETEWGALVLTLESCRDCAEPKLRNVTIRLPENRVFEDNAPRIFLDGDERPLVMVVETDLELGARLAVYNADGVVAATPFIGRPQRWLAPIGAADLDGDGMVEIAYIDRPHLAKILRVWRLTRAGLVEVAQMDGLSNHRFGWPDIAGGIRDCGQGPEIIVASGDWREVMAVRLKDGQLGARVVGAYSGQNALSARLGCAN